MTAHEFAARLRRRERILGYWSVMDCPVSTEWLAHLGWDYIALDLQHGIIGYSGMVAGLTAIDAAGRAGARRSQRPRGCGRRHRSPGEHRGRGTAGGRRGDVPAQRHSVLRTDACTAPHRPLPADTDRDTVVLAMIETPHGLANVEEICAVPGLDGIYVGPSDLRLAVGGAHSQDPAVDDEFEAALVRARQAAAAAGIAAAIHTPEGAVAAQRLAEGFTVGHGGLRSGAPQAGVGGSSQGGDRWLSQNDGVSVRCPKRGEKVRPLWADSQLSCAGAAASSAARLTSSGWTPGTAAKAPLDSRVRGTPA